MSDRDAFVLDTNVLVDALLFKRSFGRRAFDIVRASGTLVLSPATYSELVEVLYRPASDAISRRRNGAPFSTGWVRPAHS